jgi:hypothetical protein
MKKRNAKIGFRKKSLTENNGVRKRIADNMNTLVTIRSGKNCSPTFLR